MIIDTDVLIWYLRGNENAQKIISANIPFKISVITYMELIQGAMNKNEMKIIQKHLQKWATDIIQISKNISNRAMFYVEDFFLSHSLEICDAIIAATAMESHETLLTANSKHYNMIPALDIKIFKPK